MSRHHLAVLLAAGAAALPSVASAAGAFGGMPLALAAAASLEQAQCANAALPAAGDLRASTGFVGSKADAILGGTASQLELMRRQQAVASAPIGPRALPGAGVMPRSGGECGMFVRGPSELAALRPGLGARATGTDDFLASKRLAVHRTGFDAQWNRVRNGRIAVPGLAAGSPDPATIAAVNSWANARIRYVEDRDLYGRPDYWADARSTLRRGAGDCEDIAVLKMALLAGTGVRREDMFLTIARDLARNADHAVLVVRLEGRFWLLDNATDRLLDAREANDYRPILSYSAGGKWLHGY